MLNHIFVCTTARRSDEMWSCDVVTLAFQCPHTGRVTFSNLCCLDSVPQEPRTVIGQAGTSSALSLAHTLTNLQTHTQKSPLFRAKRKNRFRKRQKGSWREGGKESEESHNEALCAATTHSGSLPHFSSPSLAPHSLFKLSQPSLSHPSIPLSLTALQIHALAAFTLNFCVLGHGKSFKGPDTPPIYTQPSSVFIFAYV